MTQRFCPKCHREFDQGYLKCPYDGSSLSDLNSKEDRYLGLELAGSYQIVRRIGEGGMGAVYEARHMRLNTPFAIKILFPELSLNEELLARFHREARSASQLKHPNILDVFDVNSTDDGLHYIVEEFLEGKPLSDILISPPIVDTLRGIKILLQVCDAMSVAHQQGIVHRDIKPENIFLIKRRDTEDFVKVLDFGIAKMQEEGKSQLTQQSQVMGTPDYISPEQALDSKSVDARSDIYSLGVMCYRMFSGRLPYEINKPAAALAAVASKDPVSVRTRYDQIDPELEALIEKAMQRDPEKRFQSMKEVSNALEAIADGLGVDIPKTMMTSSSSSISQPNIISQHGKGSNVTGPLDQRMESHVSKTVASQNIKAKKFPVAIVAALGLIAVVAITLVLFLRKDTTAPLPKKSELPISALVDKTPIKKKPAEKPKDVEKTGPKTIKGMVFFKGGSFLMGKKKKPQDTYAEYKREIPQHQCKVDNFYLDQKEVTKGDFLSFLRSKKGERFRKEKIWKSFNPIASEKDLPIAMVNWYEADAYCKAINKRLPRESEWEYVAKKLKVDDLLSEENANFCRLNDPKACKKIKTRIASQAIGGISDLIGNVGEWVDGIFGYYTKTCGKYRLAKEFGKKAKRVRTIRGGSTAEWKKHQLSSTFRFAYWANGRDATLGFRCAKGASE